MQLKPEHAPKKETRLEFAARDFKERNGDKVKTQWRVEEWRPAHTEWGYDGQYYPPKRLDYTEWFETEEEAEVAMDKYEPSKGNMLKLTSRSLYRKWIPGHWQEKWI